MTQLDAELGKAFDNGGEIELGNGYNFKRPLRAALNPVTLSIDISVTAEPGTGSAYVIAGGVVVLLSTSPDVQLETEGLASSDLLDTLTPHADMGPGTVVILKSTNSTRDVTVKHNTGNIRMVSGIDYTLATTTARLAVMWSGSYWRELWRET